MANNRGMMVKMEAIKTTLTTPPPQPSIPPIVKPQRRARIMTLFAPELVRPAFKEAFLMLRPDVQWTNPVMFVVEVGSFLTLLFIIQAAVSQSVSQISIGYF